MKGVGKYDHEIRELLKRLDAEGIVLIVMDGIHGSGFGVMGTLEAIGPLPSFLRHVAADMEEPSANAQWVKNLQVEKDFRRKGN